MNTDLSNSKKSDTKRLLKRLAVIAASVCVVIAGIAVLIYIFVIPTKYEMAVGEALPKSAEVLHSDYDFVPLDPIHRFVIAYTDDQARDQLINKWNLLAANTSTGGSNIMSSDMSNAPTWWPPAQLEHLEKHGECYGRIDDQAERWWTVWVDPDSKLLYFEAGDW